MLYYALLCSAMLCQSSLNIPVQILSEPLPSFQTCHQWIDWLHTHLDQESLATIQTECKEFKSGYLIKP